MRILWRLVIYHYFIYMLYLYIFYIYIEVVNGKEVESYIGSVVIYRPLGKVTESSAARRP